MQLYGLRCRVFAQMISILSTVPKAVPEITLGHEIIEVIENIRCDVKTVKPGDRVAVNAETYCGKCFFVKKDLSTTVLMRTAVGHFVVGFSEV